MSQSLENCINDYMKHILITFTKHKYFSIVIGIVLTAIMQSSSAMTMMLIGCLNSHLISLKSAMWILMGANIGTTITGQIIALDINHLAPILAIIGVILLLTPYETIAEVMIGLGLLFMGLDILQLGLSSIHIDMFLKTNHSLIMILYGFLLTSIIQSSSASIGILQSLVAENLMPFAKAVYLIFGFNMGSCMTGVLASLVSNNDGKRLAIFHLLMNGIGVLIFYGLCSYTPLIQYFENIISNPLQQIAHMHTFFNVITTIIILLINQPIIKTVYYIIPHQHTLANPSKEC